MTQLEKKLLTISEIVETDERAKKIICDLLDTYYKRETSGIIRRISLFIPNQLINIFLLIPLLIAYINLIVIVVQTDLSFLTLFIIAVFSFLSIFTFYRLLFEMLENLYNKINEKYIYKMNNDELDYLNYALYEQKQLIKLTEKDNYKKMKIYSYYQINKTLFNNINIVECKYNIVDFEYKIWE